MFHVLLAWLLLGFVASSQIRFLTLEQAGSRTGTDSIPAYEGEEVAVVGQVSMRALWLADTYALPIQDNAGYGLLLEGSPLQIEGFGPGDWIQTRGSMVRRAGLPMLVIRDIQKFQTSSPPAPRPVSIAELNSIRYVGVRVTVEGVVTRFTEDSAGDLLTIADKPDTIDVLLHRLHNNGHRLRDFHPGDRVHVTGISAEHSLAPHNRSFRIVIPDSSEIALMENPWSPPPSLLLIVLLVGAVLGTWWIRERRMGRQRRQLHTMNRLVEEVATSASPAEILSKLNGRMPRISDGSRISLYLFNRGSKLLESVTSRPSEPQIKIRPEAPEGALATGVALCLRNRTLLAVPDPRRSPFFKVNGEGDVPRSIMFVPMFAQNELLGVMELAYPKAEHTFTLEEQTAMQHLANQVATALRLQDQKSIREQLFRSERLAAGGQLISGVAAELRHPLSSILDLIADLKKSRGVEYSSELDVIRSEAERASQIVGRLVSFGKIGQMDAEPVDITALLLGLLRFRANERKQKGIDILPQILNQRVMVMGSQGQLEQVFLNLLVHAEQAAAEARDVAMSISTSLLAKRILIEISYHTQLNEDRKTDPFSDTEAEGGVLGLGLCRAIVQSHGGEIRLVHVSATQSRFDVELPVMEAAQSLVSANAPHIEAGQRALTFLTIEPEAATQKQLLTVLSQRGHRVIPVTSPDEGIELVRRLKFDASVCSTHLPGMNWVDFYERIRNHVESFVLLTDGYDADLANAFQGGEGFVLSKPLDVPNWTRIVRLIEQRIMRSE